jgi:alpha-tubulin suppressor-like RCC1 family protein
LGIVNFKIINLKKLKKKKQKDMFSFGSNIYGQLGFSRKNPSSSITFFDNKEIKDFCCGIYSSYVLIGYFYFKFLFYYFLIF